MSLGKFTSNKELFWRGSIAELKIFFYKILELKLKKIWKSFWTDDSSFLPKINILLINGFKISLFQTKEIHTLQYLVVEIHVQTL